MYLYVIYTLTCNVTYIMKFVVPNYIFQSACITQSVYDIKLVFNFNFLTRLHVLRCFIVNLRGIKKLYFDLIDVKHVIYYVLTLFRNNLYAFISNYCKTTIKQTRMQLLLLQNQRNFLFKKLAALFSWSWLDYYLDPEIRIYWYQQRQ